MIHCQRYVKSYGHIYIQVGFFQNSWLQATAQHTHTHVGILNSAENQPTSWGTNYN